MSVTTGNPQTSRADIAKKMLSKVPEVTIYFWIIKIPCTTVGETFADLLNVNLGPGLTITTMGTLAFLFDKPVAALLSYIGVRAFVAITAFLLARFVFHRLRRESRARSKAVEATRT